MTIYKCYFTLEGIWYEVESKDGILDFSNGFWVNDDFQFTKGEDASYWIPPRCIRYIQKVK